jgi:hypothetical protein
MSRYVSAGVLSLLSRVIKNLGGDGIDHCERTCSYDVMINKEELLRKDLFVCWEPHCSGLSRSE